MNGTLTGQCHCGKITYELSGTAMNHALCHCADCRRHAGAPLVGWAMYPVEALTVKTGEPKIYHSSNHGRRHFCGDCGTGLFYVNEEMLPGLTDVQTGTLDNPDALPAQAHIQMAEAISWAKNMHELPQFERYPEF